MGIEPFIELKTIVVHRSITSAAEALNISQPTLSRHLLAFEQTLGQRLFFDRNTYQLTLAGEIALKYAEDIINSYGRLKEELSNLCVKQSENIIIQDSRHLNRLFVEIDSVINSMRTTNPETVFCLHRLLERKTPIEALASQIDLGFDYTISESSDESLEAPKNIGSIQLPHFRLRLRFLVPKDSLLVKKKGLKLADFSNENFQIPAPRSHENFRAAFTAICKKHGFTPRFVFRQEDNLLEFYLNGSGGVYITGTPLLDGGIRSIEYSKYYVPVEIDEDIFISAYAIYRKDKQSSGFKNFIDELTRTCEQSRKGC